MRLQKESKLVWVLAAVGLLVVFSLCCFNENLARVGDNIFLYNRCLQARDCLKNGLYPFLYYEDVGGIGYGSPIFYGQLTLFPFMLFLDDISVFLKVYYLCCLLLNFFGFRLFLKRVSSYATLTSCFYIFSMPFLGVFNGNIPANALAVGFSWMFFAYCIDFFRDRRSFCPLILTYFMIWQSNFNSTILATIVCFGIFVVYFCWSHWKDYLKLILCAMLVISYNLMNIFVHRDAIALSDPSVLLGVLNVDSDCRLLSIHPIGSRLFRVSVSGVDCCTGFISFVAFAVFAYYIIRYARHESVRFKVCSVCIGVALVAGHIVGSCVVWPDVYKATNVFFQFPIRYYVLLFGFALAVLSRVIRPSFFVYIAIFLSIVDFVLVNPFKSVYQEDVAMIGIQMGNGEYASSKFMKNYDVYDLYGTSVVSENGAFYTFNREYGVVEVDCSQNTGDDVLTLPKLYYKGYQAFGSAGECFPVLSGYSNYCQVAIGDYQGILRLEYRVPGVVLFFFFVQVTTVASLVYRCIFGFPRRRVYAKAK